MRQFVFYTKDINLGYQEHSLMFDYIKNTNKYKTVEGLKIQRFASSRNFGGTFALRIYLGIYASGTCRNAS